MKGIAASLFLQITIWAQTAPVVLSIDVENRVFYQFDISDYLKLASEPVRTNPPAVKTFASTLGIADIVAINGKPARGTWTLRATVVNLGGGCQCGPEPVSAASGTAIADTTRNNYLDVVWDILTPDGTPVGSIMASGASGGMPAPGSPLCSHQFRPGDYWRNRSFPGHAGTRRPSTGFGCGSSGFDV